MTGAVDLDGLDGTRESPGQEAGITYGDDRVVRTVHDQNRHADARGDLDRPRLVQRDAGEMAGAPEDRPGEEPGEVHAADPRGDGVAEVGIGGFEDHRADPRI